MPAGYRPDIGMGTVRVRERIDMGRAAVSHTTISHGVITLTLLLVSQKIGKYSNIPRRVREMPLR